MNKVSVILKTLIVGYVITVAALLLLSFCLYKFRVSDSIISVGIYVTYGLSALCGGLFLAKSMKRNRLMWGALYGVIYFHTWLRNLRGRKDKYLPVSDEDIAQMVKSAALCILCGAVGGVIS